MNHYLNHYWWIETRSHPWGFQWRRRCACGSAGQWNSDTMPITQKHVESMHRKHVARATQRGIDLLFAAFPGTEEVS